MTDTETGAIGVVVVTYNSSDVIIPCLESLLASDHPDLRVVVCDNSSPDDTVDVIRDWAVKQDVAFAEREVGREPPDDVGSATQLLLLRSSVNGGFAAGVNLGLKTLLKSPDVGLFWILNPDCIVPPATASAYARAAAEAGPFSLMGGRLAFPDSPHVIQSDGGRIGRWTGICRNANQGNLPDAVAPPDPETLDYVAGANFVASRQFIETAGLMQEDYFLYFEEIDWAFRRGDLPLKFCQTALVYHHNGTAIGSGSLNQRASAFSNYFNYRNRMRFVRRHFPAARVTAYLYSTAKIVKLLLSGARDEAIGAFRGLNQLPPPKAIRDRLSPDAAKMAFGSK